ncbi:putative Nucleosome assembly protein 1 [Blattamonas nauphoetae]|uniref:Nucleosome assembly protein 1 n=1 Tax=Blattamonas nauphoetae TaxID=2049346 RepID=A0ABQ9YHW3_9EUKA|nr:putative Nucleosome assembly protein 1 [Blattamonas nauphoetae]
MSAGGDKPANPFLAGGSNPFAQSSNPFGAPAANPFGAPAANPFGAPGANPFGQDPALNALSDIFQKKFKTLMGQPSGLLDELSGPVKRRLRAVKKLQDEYNTVDDEYLDKVSELELKYAEQLRPLFAKLAQIQKGEYEPTNDELEPLNEYPPEKDPMKDKGIPMAKRPDGSERGVPDYWADALGNNDLVSSFITPNDQKILPYMEDLIITTQFEGASKRTDVLEFVFSENPFFSNDKLTLTYVTKTERKPGGVSEQHDFTGTTINWKEGQNPDSYLIEWTKKVKQKGKKGKKGPAKETKHTRTFKGRSFFDFFRGKEACIEHFKDVCSQESDVVDALTAKHDIKEDDMDEAEDNDKYDDYQNEKMLVSFDSDIEEVEMAMEEALDTIAKEIYVHSYLWFTGEADKLRGSPDMDDDDSDDEDDDDIDEDKLAELLQQLQGGKKGKAKKSDDSDDDSGDDDPKAKGKGGGKQLKGNEVPQECQTQ